MIISLRGFCLKHLGEHSGGIHNETAINMQYHIRSMNTTINLHLPQSVNAFTWSQVSYSVSQASSLHLGDECAETARLCHLTPDNLKTYNMSLTSPRGHDRSWKKEEEEESPWVPAALLYPQESSRPSSFCLAQFDQSGALHLWTVARWPAANVSQ